MFGDHLNILAIQSETDHESRLSNSWWIDDVRQVKCHACAILLNPVYMFLSDIGPINYFIGQLMWPCRLLGPQASLLNSLCHLETMSLSLSGSFTPCRHLRPSSGREHTYSHITYSLRWWWLPNETRKKHTTETGCPTLLPDISIPMNTMGSTYIYFLIVHNKGINSLDLDTCKL